MRKNKLSNVSNTILHAAIALVVFAATGTRTEADVIKIDFEGLRDSTILSSEYPGLSLKNAVILTAGITLNEFEFPPQSGVNVISDNGGALTITFASPVRSFSGYFSHAEPLTLAAFDGSNIQGASGTSGSSRNLAGKFLVEVWHGAEKEEVPS